MREVTAATAEKINKYHSGVGTGMMVRSRSPANPFLTQLLQTKLFRFSNNKQGQCWPRKCIHVFCPGEVLQLDPLLFLLASGSPCCCGTGEAA